MSEQNILETSVIYGLTKTIKLRIEIDLLVIEHQRLTGLASELGDYQRRALPMENLEPVFDDIWFKWSEQANRYFAMSKEVNQIFESKAKELQEVFAATLHELNKLPRPLPDSVQNKIEKLVGLSENSAEKSALTDEVIDLLNKIEN